MRIHSQIDQAKQEKLRRHSGRQRHPDDNWPSSLHFQGEHLLLLRYKNERDREDSRHARTSGYLVGKSRTW